MRRKLLTAVAATTLGLTLPLLSGCSGGGASPPAQQLTDQDKAKLLAPRDEFESGKNVPIAADTHFAAGQLAEGQGKLDQAVQQYEKALKLNPQHRDALFRTGVVLVKQRKLPAAIETWNKYVAVTNGDATAYANLGFAFELAGRTTEAEQAFQKGIRRDPANAACRVNYGLMLARKERFNEALLQLQTVLGDAEVQYNLASVYEGLGRKEQAKIAYKKALAADPRMKDAEARLDALQ